MSRLQRNFFSVAGAGIFQSDMKLDKPLTGLSSDLKSFKSLGFELHATQRSA